MRNLAAIIRKPLEIVMQDIGSGELQPGYARIRVKAIGICGSDINYFKGAAQTAISYPLVIGHEVAGEITDINGDPNGFQIGDPVVISPYAPCGHCYPCSIGRSNCCTDIKVYGTHIDGCAMEWCDHPVGCLARIPAGLPWEKAAMAEPLAIALHGISRLRLKAGEHVVIIGAGAIGALSAIVALDTGAVPIVLDIAQAKLDFARNYGVQYVINTCQEDARERISQITGGRMAEAVMEISGANQSVLDSFAYVANAGRIILTGWAKSPLELDTRQITRKEIDVLGQRNTDLAEISRALESISSGRADVMKTVTRIIPFSDMAATVERMAAHPDENVKVLAIL